MNLDQTHMSEIHVVCCVTMNYCDALNKKCLTNKVLREHDGFEVHFFMLRWICKYNCTDEQLRKQIRQLFKKNEQKDKEIVELKKKIKLLENEALELEGWLYPSGKVYSYSNN